MCTNFDSRFQRSFKSRRHSLTIDLAHGFVERPTCLTTLVKSGPMHIMSGFVLAFC